MSAWADYVDARQQLVHQWSAEGASVAEITSRLEITAPRVEVWLRTAPHPFPGSSRFQLIEWQRRAESAERQLQTVPPPSSGAPPSLPPPSVSEFRALALRPEPELCGCQYWQEAPLPEGEHHPHCEHAGK